MWSEIAETALTSLLCEDCEFPEENAQRLARMLIDMSEPEFGEDDFV